MFAGLSRLKILALPSDYFLVLRPWGLCFCLPFFWLESRHLVGNNLLRACFIAMPYFPETKAGVKCM